MFWEAEHRGDVKDLPDLSHCRGWLMMEPAVIGWFFTSRWIMSYCCSHRLYTPLNPNSCFFNLGKAACLIEMGYCRILIISSDLISKTLKIRRWMLKMRNLIHSKIQRLLKSCVSLLVHFFKKRNGKEMNLQTPFMAQSTINAHFT